MSGLSWRSSHWYVTDFNATDLHVQVASRQLALLHDSVAFRVSFIDDGEMLALKCYETIATVFLLHTY